MDDCCGRSDILVLQPLGRVTEEGWTTLRWRMLGGGTDFTLTHAVPQKDAGMMVDDARGDHALLPVLLHAMASHRDIHVEGEVSPDLLANLETLQEIWSRWRPERYRRISITAAREKPLDRPATGRTVFAFSGGVDAAYSLFRHLSKAEGRRTRHPDAALMVHGLDIPLALADMFVRAQARAEHMIEDTGVPLLLLRTNSREMRVAWEDGYGLQLMAAMLVLQPAFDVGLHGSEEPWEALVFPWGSTPFTDRHCETRHFGFIHHGCAASRTEKVDWLVRHTTACRDLRVCWEGIEKDRNCGQCEKCMRTKLNFWAMRHDLPESLPGGLDPRAIAAIRPKNRLQLKELQSLAAIAALHHQSSEPAARALRHCLNRSRMRFLKQDLTVRARRRIKEALTRGG